MKRMSLLKRNRAKEIVVMIRNEKRPRAIENKLSKHHPYDISEAMLAMTDEERALLYSYMTPRKLAKTFEHLSEEKGAEFLEDFAHDKAVEILSLMDADDSVDILQELKYHDAMELLGDMPSHSREKVRVLYKYGRNTAGSEMNNNFISLKADMDIKDAMRHLVENANKVELIDTLFVIDDNQKLKGTVDLKDMIVAKHPITIGEITSDNYYSVHVLDGIQEVITDIRKYDTTAMPVVNDDGKIEGIITMYDAMDIIEEESHEDYALLAGLPAEDDVFDNARQSARKRFPWLALLLVLNMIVSTVLATYEETIAAVAALVLFQPLILGMAGNIGTQSLAVTVLRISRETLYSRVNIIRHMVSEALIGVFNGLLLGGLSFLTAWGFLTLVGVGEAAMTVAAIEVAGVVGLSVFTALSVSAFLGATIPMILNALKFDPAVASGPFITTVNDITALMVYFTLASVLLLTL